MTSFLLAVFVFVDVSTSKGVGELEDRGHTPRSLA